MHRCGERWTATLQTSARQAHDQNREIPAHTPLGRTAATVERGQRGHGLHRTKTGTKVLHRPNHAARFQVRLSLSNPSWRHLVCNPIQRLHGHDGEDAETTGSRLVLPGTSVVVVRYENINQDFYQHYFR